MNRNIFCALTAMALSSSGFGANLVTNPSFECSTVGWTTVGSAAYTPGVANEGSCSGLLGFAFPDTYAGGLSQPISTVIGNRYALSFWVAAASNGQPFTVSASFGSINIPLPLSSFPISFVFHEITAEAVASSATSILLFNAAPTSGRVFFDSVSVTNLGPVPESGTLTLTGAGLALLALARTKRLSRKAA